MGPYLWTKKDLAIKIKPMKVKKQCSSCINLQPSLYQLAAYGLFILYFAETALLILWNFAGICSLVSLYVFMFCLFSEQYFQKTNKISHVKLILQGCMFVIFLPKILVVLCMSPRHNKSLCQKKLFMSIVFYQNAASFCCRFAICFLFLMIFR